MQEREPDMIIRASSLAMLFDCAARWRAQHLEGRRMPTSAAAVVGTAVHRGADVFDSNRLLGTPISVSDATDAAADSVKNPQYEVRWDDFRPSEAVDISVRLTQQYCHDLSPKFDYSLVETQLKDLDVISDNGVMIRFTGKIDRERRQDGMKGIVDFKTGKTLIDSAGNVKVALSAAQLGQYELLTLMADGTMAEKHLLPAQIVAMPTVKGKEPKIATLKTSPHSLLIGDDHNKGMIAAAAMFYKEDMFIGNPRSMLCSDKYCPIFNNCRWRITEEAE